MRRSPGEDDDHAGCLRCRSSAGAGFADRSAGFGARRTYEREADEWWWLHHECKMMESRDGRELSGAESDKACEARDQLFIKLQENGYCHDKIELEMVPCADIRPD
jgi:hypothetical protein